jgi:preprotein translocase subunit SecG
MLDIFITLVVIAHVVVSLLLILVILMQRPKQEGLGAAFGAGMTDAAFGAKTTDVLQKGTVYLGTLFFIFSLVLAILMGKRNAIEGKNYASDGGSSASAPVETTEAENSVLGNAGNVVAPVPAESIAPPAEAIAPPAEAIAPPAEAIAPPAEAIAPPAETNEAPENPDESPTDGANTPTEENKVPVGG